MTKLKEIVKIKRKVFVHEEIRIGWFRFVYYRLGSKFCIRMELQNGW